MEELINISRSLDEAGFSWPNQRTLLVMLDVSLFPIPGLDTTSLPEDVKECCADDLETSLQDIEQFIAHGRNGLTVTDGAQGNLSLKAALHLGLACAQVLRWTHVRDDGTVDLSELQEHARCAVQLFGQCKNHIGVLWSSFIKDLASIICQSGNGETDKSHSLTIGRQLSATSKLGETAANVCLRLGRKMRSSAADLHASGDFDRRLRLLQYGIGLSETFASKIILAQMHATLAGLYVEVNEFAIALKHFRYAYDFAITGKDYFRAPIDYYKQLVDEILHSCVETNDEKELENFYVRLRDTWLQRFERPGEEEPLQWWEDQHDTRITQIRSRILVRENLFHKAQRIVRQRLDQPLPADNSAASHELYRRSTLGMNYGQLDLAKRACEKLDTKSIDYFSRVARWEETPQNTWRAFEICVERTAFKNSVRFFERLKAIPNFLNLSPQPSNHDNLGDYLKLVQVARLYMFQGLWIDALALLKCSCSLVAIQRQKIASKELQDRFYNSTSAEKAFDWTVWVCLHFQATSVSFKPNDLDEETTCTSWVEEALRFAELGKARRIGDSLQEQHIETSASTEAVQRDFDVSANTSLVKHLSSWLDPNTLVVHLTLCDEGLGLICCDIDGIHHAQWFQGLPGLGRWDLHCLTSQLYLAIGEIEEEKLDWEDESLFEHRKILEMIEQLSTALIVPIRDILKRTIRKRICFVPSGQLNRVPFAALEFDGEPLIARFTVYQVPSLRILEELTMGNKEKSPDINNISVVVRASHDKVSLMETAVECVDILAQARGVVSIQSALDLAKEDFLALFKRCDILHVGTHGHMNYRKPTQSSISLQQDLYVTDMQHIRSAAKLIFFSACLTGLGHSSSTDDVTGFQAQILQSGASAFVGSIWNCHALASLFFSHFFYECIVGAQDGVENLADAFTVAQRRLRSLNSETARQVVRTLEQQWSGHRTTAGLHPADVKLAAEFFEEYEQNHQDSYAHMYYWAPYTFIGYPSNMRLSSIPIDKKDSSAPKAFAQPKDASQS